MEILKIPALRSPVALIAFSGWSDAAEAATAVASHLLSAWKNESDNDVLAPRTSPELIAEIDSEEFYDFQVNRPMVYLDKSQIRSLKWPGMQVFGLQMPEYDFDFVIIRGVEPSLKWKTFSQDLLDLTEDLEVSQIITLGAMLADAPHSRPISVIASSAHPDVAKRLGVQISTYEGPTGILGAIQDACLRRGIDAVSLWAAVPHYASNSPSPKATLALLNALEDFLNIKIAAGELPTQARKWESEIDELASSDERIADYVQALENSKDSFALLDVSGDELAVELERFLRRESEN